MVSPLDRKLLRDLWRMKGQAVAIGIVIATGVMMLVMMTGLVTSLNETRRAYYERYRLAEVFAPVTRAPERLLSHLAAIDALPAGGIYVLELSSYQLDITFSLACEVAILLNITPDHLERHGTLAAYAAAKARLFAMQAPFATAIVGMDAEAEHDVLDDAEEPLIAFIEDIDAGNQAEWPALQGPHNLQNARAAVAACAALGLTPAEIAAGLRSYPGLPHRMQRIGEKAGVLWVNDSKATNADSSAPALSAFPGTHWIAGGRPKLDSDGKADLGAVLPHLGNVKAAYLIGEAAPLFEAILRPLLPVTVSGTLDRAVADAAAAAQPGDTVLLSPACASFDQFRDFEARGDAFVALVGALA